MADSDYICVYRQFFEEFAKSSTAEDHRPMRLNIYNLLLDELVGEVMQSCVNFLTERQCPNSLIVPLTRIVVEELLSEAKKQPEEVNDPLKLNKKTHEKISEVCLRYTDNEKLSSLPPPVAETPFSTHSTKHTRRRMEDRHICLPRFNTLHGVQSNSEAEYYAIFDGHAGVTAASFAVSHLHQFLAESKFYPDDIVQAFREAYEKTESRFNSKDDCGTTSLAILYQPMEKKMTVSWIGDSQALLVTEDSYAMLVDPHKPERQDERKRIENLGGFVMKLHDSYRVNGEIGISRAIGDKKLKPYVSAEPEFRVLNLTGSEHFVVMGCDGLWDVVEPEQVIETVYFELKNNNGRIGTVAKRLVDLAKENNSTDNISVITFFLTDPCEINNRSVDVTGHRPKIIDQNGSMMEANIQSNDSPLNGIYETSNGNFHHGLHHNSHGYEDQMRNESDEDLGPETDVDALDDVLVSPKGGGNNNNNNNPFASVGNDCWQTSKAQFTDCSGKLIEFANSLEESVKMGGEREMEKEFQGGFGETVKVSSDDNVDHASEEIRENDVLNMKYMNNMESDDGLYDVMNSKYKNEADGVPEDSQVDENHRWLEQNNEIISNKLSLDDENSFQGSVINNYSNALNVQNNGLDENKCVSEMGQEETEKSGTTNSTDFNPYAPTGNETFEKGRLEFDGQEPERKIIEGIENVVASENTIPEMGFRSPEIEVESDSDLIKSVPEKMDADKAEMELINKVELETQQQQEDLFGAGEEKLLTGGNDSSVFDNVEMVTNESTVQSDQPEAENFTSRNYAALTGEKNGSENSPEIRLSDVDSSVEEEKKFENDFAPGSDGNFPVENREEVKSDLLAPSAPSADELTTITDEIVAESGGEVDSEDDEWNYIKVGSGGGGGDGAPVEENNQQPQEEPQQEKEEGRSQQEEQEPTYLVPSEDPIEEEKVAATMNSPLNPDAAEFVPISPVSATDGDFVMETPVKNLPKELMADDIVAASPNWSTMRNVALPEESAFLNEIKSRPSNIMEDLQFTQKNEFEAFEQVGSNEAVMKNNFELETENREQETASPEPRGLALATDMTGSFIDPSTMSSGDEFSTQHNASIIPEIKEPIVEERLMHLTSEKPQMQEAVVLEQTNATSELTELISPAPADECFSPQSMTGATPKSTVAEVASSPESEASTLPIADVQASPLLDLDVREPSESTPASAPVEIIDLTSSPVETTEVAESLLVEESKEKVVAAAAAGAVAAVVSAAASVAAATKKDEKKPAPRSTPGKATKPLGTTTTKPSVADTKTGSPTKKPSTVTKTTATGRVSSATSASTPTKPTASRVSSMTKTAPKSPGSTSSTVNKVPAPRSKPATTAVTSTVSRTPLTRTTVTTTTVKSTATAPKPAARTTSTTLTAKPKPRVPSAPLEKKTTMNGDIKTAMKKTETSTAAKKPVGTSSLTSTRMSLSARPATAPAKPTATSRTTVTTTTRTLTAKPKTAISSSTTTTTTTVTSSGKVSSVTKRTTIGSEKQAKEMANRLTSKTLTSAAPKMNGIGPGKPGSTTLKSKRTVTTTTTKTGSTPSKTKPVSKTDSKAETIVQKTVEIIQSEAETPIIEHTKDINLINSIASD